MFSNGKPVRPWQDIVEEASRERDPEKLRRLSEELEAALDERAKKLRVQPMPDDMSVNKRQESA